MLSVKIKENDKVVGELAAAEKLFKTGSRGYFGMGMGGIVKREASLDASNVQLVCPECGVAPTRIGHKVLGDGRKVRICRKCQGVVDR